MRKSISSLIISSFLILIFIGTILLLLPISTQEGTINPVDALFTSTSAVTVTGLIVKDTASDFTFFGQLVILFLIQIGGLGIMTFSTFAILMMGKSFSLKDKNYIDNDFTPGGYKNVKDLGKKIVILTFGFELLGAVAFYFQFSQFKGFHRIFVSIFHSVSAFCNAGFSIFSNSFEDFSSHWGINMTLIILIIFGGIGFLVLNELGLFLKRKIKNFSRFSLHTKLVLLSSLFLVVFGFIVIFLEEIINPLNHLSLNEKIISSLFQSVTARTAGFNTINLNILSIASIFIIMVLMFIGASPGSTGGGIKTSSASLVIAYLRSQLKGRERTDVFYRNIPDKTIEKAFVFIILSLLVVAGGFLFLVSFESNFGMTELLFEVVSAFGTVGLSLGITSKLSILSKFTIITTMFIGRVGLLTILIALSKIKMRGSLKYPEEKIMIG